MTAAAGKRTGSTDVGCLVQHDAMRFTCPGMSVLLAPPISNTRPCMAKELSISLWNKQDHEEMYGSKNQK